MIYYYTIDFDKKNNKRKRRFILTLDAPINKNDNENALNLIDVQPALNSIEKDYYENIQSFKELIESENLYKIYQQLTDKQKEILDLIYIHGFSNKEVALIYDETPQNISNIHKRTINKIKEAIKDEE